MNRSDVFWDLSGPEYEKPKEETAKEIIAKRLCDLTIALYRLRYPEAISPPGDIKSARNFADAILHALHEAGFEVIDRRSE